MNPKTADTSSSGGCYTSLAPGGSLDWVAPSRWTTVVLTLLACGLILFARMPDRLLRPQFFAEDALFYADALKEGGAALLRPYGGYLLVVPRLAAWAGAHLPVLWVPAFFNAGALALGLSVLGRLFSPRVALPYKPCLALAAVLIPHVEDIFLVMENVQWILSLALMLVLISADAATPGQRFGDAAIAILGGLTGVFSILMAPFYVLRAVGRRSRQSCVLAAIVGAAALIQAWIVVHSEGYHAYPPVAFEPAMIPALVGFRLWVHLFSGRLLVALSDYQLAVAGVAGIGIIGWMLADGRIPLPQRRIRQTFAAFMIVQTAASIFRFHELWPVLLTPQCLDRYFYLPQLFIIWMLLTGAAAGGPNRVVAGAAAAAYLLTAQAHFRCEPLIDYQWPRYAALIQQRQRVLVPINPEGWHFLYTGGPETTVMGNAPPPPPR